MGGGGDFVERIDCKDMSTIPLQKEEQALTTRNWCCLDPWRVSINVRHTFKTTLVLFCFAFAHAICLSAWYISPRNELDLTRTFFLESVCFPPIVRNFPVGIFSGGNNKTPLAFRQHIDLETFLNTTHAAYVLQSASLLALFMLSTYILYNMRMS